jgi:hypothetical protein
VSSSSDEESSESESSSESDSESSSDPSSESSSDDSSAAVAGNFAVFGFAVAFAAGLEGPAAFAFGCVSSETTSALA